MSMKDFEGDLKRYLTHEEYAGEERSTLRRIFFHLQITGSLYTAPGVSGAQHARGVRKFVKSAIRSQVKDEKLSQTSAVTVWRKLRMAAIRQFRMMVMSEYSLSEKQLSKVFNAVVPKGSQDSFTAPFVSDLLDLVENTDFSRSYNYEALRHYIEAISKGEVK
jgi:hypothetical protein